jgi:hypothetical protein
MEVDEVLSFALSPLFIKNLGYDMFFGFFLYFALARQLSRAPPPPK